MTPWVCTTGSKRIVVVGYYNYGNIGDEAFKQSIPYVLGCHSYTYVNEIPANVNEYDVLVIGGGSFLDTPIPGCRRTVNIPVLFLGVGIHKVVHIDNLPLLREARLVVARNAWGNEIETLVLPDLVFARPLPGAGCAEKEIDNPKSVLFIMNAFYLPMLGDTMWKLSLWNDFKVKVLDRLDSCFEEVNYIAMQTTGIDDRFMRPDLNIGVANEEHFVEAIQRADLVFTTRFHGCVYSTLLGTPFVGISCHDKMLSYFLDRNWDNVTNYGSDLEDVLEMAQYSPSPANLRIHAQESLTLWKVASPMIRAAMGLT